MTLKWSLVGGTDLILVSGEKVLNRTDFDDYLAAITAAGYKGFHKLIDLCGCTLDLTHEDIEAIADGFLLYNESNGPGMIAVVVNTPLLLDMMILVKQHVERHRAFRIFVNPSEAREWIRSGSHFRKLSVA